MVSYCGRIILIYFFTGLISFPQLRFTIIQILEIISVFHQFRIVGRNHVKIAVYRRIIIQISLIIAVVCSEFGFCCLWVEIFTLYKSGICDKC